MGRAKKTEKTTAAAREIGRRIRTLRKIKKWTLEQLGSQPGVNRSAQAVSGWESGSSMPDPEILAAVAKALGERPDYLMGNELPPRDSVERITQRLVKILGRVRLMRLASIPESALPREIDAMLGAYADARGRLKVSSE